MVRITFSKLCSGRAYISITTGSAAAAAAKGPPLQVLKNDAPCNTVVQPIYEHPKGRDGPCVQEFICHMCNAPPAACLPRAREAHPPRGARLAATALLAAPRAARCTWRCRHHSRHCLWVLSQVASAQRKSGNGTWSRCRPPNPCKKGACDQQTLSKERTVKQSVR